MAAISLKAALPEQQSPAAGKDMVTPKAASASSKRKKNRNVTTATQDSTEPDVALAGFVQAGVAQAGVAQAGVAQAGVAQAGVALAGIPQAEVAQAGGSFRAAFERWSDETVEVDDFCLNSPAVTVDTDDDTWCTDDGSVNMQQYRKAKAKEEQAMQDMQDVQDMQDDASETGFMGLLGSGQNYAAGKVDTWCTDDNMQQYRKAEAQEEQAMQDMQDVQDMQDNASETGFLELLGSGEPAYAFELPKEQGNLFFVVRNTFIHFVPGVSTNSMRRCRSAGAF
jgi:hypothetical protein